MNTMQENARRDLQRILEHPALARAMAEQWDDASREAAIYLARAAGYCRLWGCDTNEAQLPPILVEPVARLLQRRIEAAMESLAEFDRAMELADTDVEEQLAAAEQLRLRMEGWAIWLALDDAIEQRQTSPDPDAVHREASELGDALLRGMRQWDEALVARADMLEPVRRTNLLQHWRGHLADEFEPPPWWLDETFWESVPEPVVPDVAGGEMVQGTTSSPAPEPLDSRTDSHGRRSVRVEWKFAESRLLAAGEERDKYHPPVRFFSRPDGDGVVAEVRLSKERRPDGSLTARIAFLRVARDSARIGPGVMVALLPGGRAPLLVSHDQQGNPMWKCDLSLSPEAAVVLEETGCLRLHVGGEFWFSKELEDG